jgi:protein-disulfide isomerase
MSFGWAYRMQKRHVVWSSEGAMSNHAEDDPKPERIPEQDGLAADGARAARAMRRARLAKLGLAAAVVAAGIAIVGLGTGANRSSPPKPGSIGAIDQQVGVLLAGVPQHVNVLGAPTAPLTLEWFGDLECPYCKEFTLGALPSIIHKWVRAGVLKIEYRSMETATREHEVFERQQVAALSAGLQNKMWYFIEDFYREQGEEDSGYVTEGYLRGLASQVPGLSVALWAEDRHDPELVTQVATDLREVSRDGFSGTPAFLIGLSQGRMERLQPSSLTSPTSFDEAIEGLLA